MPDQNDDQRNIVNLADARRRQKTVREDGKGAPLGRKKPAGGKGKPAAGGPKPTLWGYVQVVIFLAVLAYAMTLCRGGGAV